MSREPKMTSYTYGMTDNQEPWAKAVRTPGGWRLHVPTMGHAPQGLAIGSHVPDSVIPDLVEAVGFAVGTYRMVTAQALTDLREAVDRAITNAGHPTLDLEG